MATATPKIPNPGDPNFAPIRKQIIDAVKVMFNRAVARDADDPLIKDNKEGLPASGNLQDCEFGMILLLVHEWFSEDSLEGDFFADVPRPEFEKVIVALVGRVVDRVLRRQQSDDGGEGDHAAFFIGEPYTQHKKDPKDRAWKYSANLDAAMITLAFLAPSIEQFNEELTKLEYNRRGLELPDWVLNLRDAALFVILDGLQYALDCRVINNGRFQGFTSDPRSNKEQPEDGGIEFDNDRLFFTWTTCETINDLKTWRDSYLNKRLKMPPPESAVSQSKSLIKELDEALLQAAEWCESNFYPRFQQFSVPDTKETVREITQLGNRKLEEDKMQQVAQIEAPVQYVYHLSQYAAIRSLVPERVSLDEVRTVVDKLDRLVSTSIISSGLDTAKNPELFKTLTRRYSLGLSNTVGYSDDAWYPLVVRSLSGLLSRTLREIGKRFARSEVLALTLTFQRSLESHVNNLTTRHAKVEEEGDAQLWSFAEGELYVLYATQRTIFALIQYATFLKTVNEFQNQEPPIDKREEELAMQLAQRLAEDYFRPVIKKWLSDNNPPVQPSPGYNKSATVNAPLPEEPWAANIVRNWLESFTADFTKSGVASYLGQMSKSLQYIKKYAENYKPPKDLEGQQKKGVENNLERLKVEFEQIRTCVGEQLSLPEKWEDGELIAVLFEYLFHKYLERPVGSSFKELLNDDNELGTLIRDANNSQTSITKYDPTAIDL